ncbi:MAG TPA: arginine decarboxylase [Chloroflexia bacterium]|nr:arginine decarboxylase [Chloroflexia bacterium]
MTKTTTGRTTYFDYLRGRFGLNTNQLTDTLHLENNRLYCQDLDLLHVSQNWGSPLEIGFTPLVTRQIKNMYGYFARAFARKGYAGKFTYAYASKAAQYEDLIRTALQAGAHYETSSPMDLQMARLHWKAGNLPSDRMILTNGFKTPAYVQNIMQLRREGFKNVLPIIESEQEIAAFANSPFDFDLGIRLRVDRSILPDGDFSRVTSRFGVPQHEIMAVAAKIAAAPNLNPVMFHAMIDTQCVDRQDWVKALLMCFRTYCELKLQYPGMRAFNFGGGMPVPYSLDFNFDYQAFADELTEGIMQLCAEYGIEHPEIIGEFGRYTAAAYGFDFYKVVVSKPSHNPDVDWYVIDGSLMSMLPDTWALKQPFIILPLNGYDCPTKRVWLSGLTCDSDDVYRSGEDDDTVVLPDVSYMKEGEELVIGVFMTGAYQDMLSGIGGVHHCLLPEPSELIIEAAPSGVGYTYTRHLPSQSVHTLASLLGYHNYLPLLASHGDSADGGEAALAPEMITIAGSHSPTLNRKATRARSFIRNLSSGQRKNKRPLAVSQTL